MFAQLTVLCLLGICYLTKSVLASCTIAAIVVWIAFAPPRCLLSWLETRDVRFWFPELSRRADGRPCAILTIDDCPSEGIEHILEAIPNGHKAYFGLIGEYVREQGGDGRCRDIHARGHGAFNHDDKNHATALQSHSAIQAGLHACELATIQLRPEFFRPGCGLYTDTTLAIASAMGHKTLLGDCYMHDCMLQWLPTTALAWLYRMRITHGSVVILHAGSMRRCRNTAAVIRALIADGVHFVPLPDSFTRSPLLACH